MNKTTKIALQYGLPVLLSVSSSRGETVILNSLSPREERVLSTLVSRYYLETEVEGQFIIIREA